VSWGADDSNMFPWVIECYACYEGPDRCIYGRG